MGPGVGAWVEAVVGAAVVVVVVVCSLDSADSADAGSGVVVGLGRRVLSAELC